MDRKPNPSGGPEETSRPPRKSDLSRICAELNRLGARYIVVGGFAVIESGYPRFTGDIDLLVDAGRENEALVFQALRILPDRAVDQLSPGDIARYTVVRIADEIVVDLMANSCGVTYPVAFTDVIYREIEGVQIPFASPATLLKMKHTVREKDIPDRLFLQKLLQSELPQSTPETPKRVATVRFWIVIALALLAGVALILLFAFQG